MIISGANNLYNNRKTVDELNVFPVPDGDTGTNMSLTATAMATELLKKGDTTLTKAADTMSFATLRGARGNSGVILSQFFRGISKSLKGKTECNAEELAVALKDGSDAAYKAVMKPTEGTILTVVREGAEFAESNYKNYDDAAKFFADILNACEESLARTPEILPVLKQAGVVDAGGCGVVTLLKGAAYALDNGSAVVLTEAESAVAPSASAATGNTKIDTANIRFQYCTEFIIQKSSADRQANQFTEAIRSKGDCMLVIDDDDIVKVHIHTNHPGFVMEQALKLGQLINIKVDNMKYQHNENIRNAENAEKAEKAEEVKLKKYGVVAVSAGEGIAEVFKSVNADRIVEGGQTMNPSTQDLLDAVSAVPAENVFILPNNKNIILAAEQVNDISDKNVIVIPTKNMPQGISAMLAFDEAADTETNTEAMKEMISAVKCGQVTFAARDSSVDGLDIHEGDVMGMIGSGITDIGSDINDVSVKICDRMIDDDSALVTVYYGADVDKETADKLASAIAAAHREVDVSVVYGGQPVYYYMIAVE